MRSSSGNRSAAQLAIGTGLVVVQALLSAVAAAADCSVTSVGRVPLSDLGAGVYLGAFQGGLYPGGLNVPPPAHAVAAHQQAVAIVPRLPGGLPAPGGKIVLLSIGMSNTTQEFCGAGRGGGCTPSSFMGKAVADPSVDQEHLVIVDGAAGGQTASTWDSPSDLNYNRVRDQELAPLGVSEAQVAAVWIKVADAGPSIPLPAPNADAVVLSKSIAAIARAVRVRYPNCRLAFLSSRIYAGYASTLLNPEPYAYESGFAVKWVVAEQISQAAGNPPAEGYGLLNIGANAPVLVWGAYLWADGLVPRGDGLIWECGDLNSDGTHPSPSGVEKVSSMLMSFFLSSPFSRPWFRTPKSTDLNADGWVDGSDLAILLSAWGPCPGDSAQDLDWDGAVNGADLAQLLSTWST
ncbi:MAG: hypothetical protein SGJ09_16890 [Phycisphaerae bacterium]|nr:hypothetical protein [Phycisphaerae bacterium]